jgi:hypothetical protein
MTSRARQQAGRDTKREEAATMRDIYEIEANDRSFSYHHLACGARLTAS